MSMCQDSSRLRYSLKLINGSYPLVNTFLLSNTPCIDAKYLSSLTQAAFFQVYSNLTQVAFYDRKNIFLFTIYKIEIIDPKTAIFSDLKTSIK